MYRSINNGGISRPLIIKLFCSIYRLKVVKERTFLLQRRGINISLLYTDQLSYILRAVRINSCIMPRDSIAAGSTTLRTQTRCRYSNSTTRRDDVARSIAQLCRFGIGIPECMVERPLSRGDSEKSARYLIDLPRRS